MDQALLLARRILLVKNATDSVEKLYYNVPVDTKASKTSKVKTKVKGERGKYLPAQRMYACTLCMRLG